MKVLYAIDTDITNGGAPISTMILARQMSKTNKILILSPSFKLEKSEININFCQVKKYIHFFPFLYTHPLQTIRLLKCFLNIINHEKPDIIHVQMPRSAMIIGILKLLNLLDKKIILLYTDREHLPYLRSIYKPFYYSFIAKVYNGVICLSKNCADYWKDKMRTSNVNIIANTGGPLYESYDPDLHENIKFKNGIGNKKLTVMFAGRMVADKNWSLALEIVKKLGNFEINFLFVIAYSNSDQYNEYLRMKGELEEISGNVLFYTNLSQKNISDLYYAADIFVLTSTHESFGRTAVEAMSRKCVVLGTNVGGLTDVISKEENIFDLDPDKFAKRISIYLKDGLLLNKDKEYFHSRYIENFTVEKNFQNHLSLYNMLKELTHL